MLIRIVCLSKSLFYLSVDGYVNECLIKQHLGQRFTVTQSTTQKPILQETEVIQSNLT